MTNSVTINGNTYNDGNYNITTNPGGLAKDGHRENFIDLISDVVVVTAGAGTNATAAAASAVAAAASALSAASVSVNALTSTSTTSLAIGTGNKSLTLADMDLPFQIGMWVKLTNSSNTSEYMWGIITAYNAGAGTMTVAVSDTAGSGTETTWNVAATGPIGPTASVDITGQTAITSIDDADELIVYDDSASINKKITYANFKADLDAAVVSAQTAATNAEDSALVFAIAFKGE